MCNVYIVYSERERQIVRIYLVSRWMPVPHFRHFCTYNCINPDYTTLNYNTNIK